MDSLPSILQDITEYSVSDLFNVFLGSYYFPAFYVLHAIFVCYNIRCTCPKGGLKWYRSFILGYLMTAGPRHLYASFMTRILPEFEHMNAFKYFAVVWILFNLCPFDLVFKFSHRKGARIAIQLLDSFSQIQNVVNSVYHGLVIYQGKPMTVASICVICLVSPIVFDVFDRSFIGQRAAPLCYQFSYIKRLLVFIALSTADLTLSMNYSMNVLDRAELILYASMFWVALAVIDLASFPGNPCFYSRDLILRDFWSEICYYYPLPVEPKAVRIAQKLAEDKRKPEEEGNTSPETANDATPNSEETAPITPSVLPPPQKQQSKKGKRH